MTEKYYILAAVFAAMMVCLVTLLLGKKGQSPDRQTTELPSKRDEQPEEEKERDKTDSMIEILEQSVGIEDHIFRSRYVPTAMGRMSCIPAMYVGPGGIMIFRFLSLEGWILGDQDSRWWTHFVSSDERRYINNPIWECREWIENLQKFLPTTDASDFRIGIIFSDHCEIRSVEPTEGVYFGNLRQLAEDFKEMLRFAKPIYDVDTVENLAMIFDAMNDPDKVVEQLINLKHKMSEKAHMIIQREKEQNEKPEETGNIHSSLSAEERQGLEKTPHASKYHPEERFTQSELLLRDALVMWRKQQADTKNLSVSEIFDNFALDNIINVKPLSIEALNSVAGLDFDTIEEYGETIVAMVKHAPV